MCCIWLLHINIHQTVFDSKYSFIFMIHLVLYYQLAYQISSLHSIYKVQSSNKPSPPPLITPPHFQLFTEIAGNQKSIYNFTTTKQNESNNKNYQRLF